MQEEIQEKKINYTFKIFASSIGVTPFGTNDVIEFARR
jgi:hypothetical protein